MTSTFSRKLMNGFTSVDSDIRYMTLRDLLCALEKPNKAEHMTKNETYLLMKSLMKMLTDKNSSVRTILVRVVGAMAAADHQAMLVALGTIENYFPEFVSLYKLVPERVDKPCCGDDCAFPCTLENIDTYCAALQSVLKRTSLTSKYGYDRELIHRLISSLLLITPYNVEVVDILADFMIESSTLPVLIEHQDEIAGLILNELRCASSSVEERSAAKITGNIPKVSCRYRKRNERIRTHRILNTFLSQLTEATARFHSQWTFCSTVIQAYSFRNVMFTVNLARTIMNFATDQRTQVAAGQALLTMIKNMDKSELEYVAVDVYRKLNVDSFLKIMTEKAGQLEAYVDEDVVDSDSERCIDVVTTLELFLSIAQHTCEYIADLSQLCDSCMVLAKLSLHGDQHIEFDEEEDEADEYNLLDEYDVDCDSPIDPASRVRASAIRCIRSMVDQQCCNDANLHLARTSFSWSFVADLVRRETESIVDQELFDLIGTMVKHHEAYTEQDETSTASVVKYLSRHAKSRTYANSTKNKVDLIAIISQMSPCHDVVDALVGILDWLSLDERAKTYPELLHRCLGVLLDTYMVRTSDMGSGEENREKQTKIGQIIARLCLSMIKEFTEVVRSTQCSPNNDDLQDNIIDKAVDLVMLMLRLNNKAIYTVFQLYMALLNHSKWARKRVTKTITKWLSFACHIQMEAIVDQCDDDMWKDVVNVLYLDTNNSASLTLLKMIEICTRPSKTKQLVRSMWTERCREYAQKALNNEKLINEHERLELLHWFARSMENIGMFSVTKHIYKELLGVPNLFSRQASPDKRMTTIEMVSRGIIDLHRSRTCRKNSEGFEDEISATMRHLAKLKFGDIFEYRNLTNLQELVTALLRCRENCEIHRAIVKTILADVKDVEAAKQTLAPFIIAFTVCSVDNQDQRKSICSLIWNAGQATNDERDMYILARIGRFFDLDSIICDPEVLARIRTQASISDQKGEKLARNYEAAVLMMLGRLGKTDWRLPDILQASKRMSTNQSAAINLIHFGLREACLSLQFESGRCGDAERRKQIADSMDEMMMKCCADDLDRGLFVTSRECLEYLVQIDTRRFLPALLRMMNQNTFACIRNVLLREENKNDKYCVNLLDAFKDSDLPEKMVSDRDRSQIKYYLHFLNLIMRHYNITTPSRQLLHILISETRINENLIKTVKIGPFSHVVDTGYEVRKAVVDCLHTLIGRYLRNDFRPDNRTSQALPPGSRCTDEDMTQVLNAALICITSDQLDIKLVCSSIVNAVMLNSSSSKRRSKTAFRLADYLVEDSQINDSNMNKKNNSNEQQSSNGDEYCSMRLGRLCEMLLREIKLLTSLIDGSKQQAAGDGSMSKAGKVTSLGNLDKDKQIELVRTHARTVMLIVHWTRRYLEYFDLRVLSLNSLIVQYIISLPAKTRDIVNQAEENVLMELSNRAIV